MRTKGTKYEAIDHVPSGALPVSKYAPKAGMSSPAYVHVKYDRFKFGYPDKEGNTVFGPYPGYDIRCYEGTNYVIEA